MSFEELERTKNQFLPKECYKLYQEDKVPEVLKGMGVWNRFGNEILFIPFVGSFDMDLDRFDWMCNSCGWLEQWSVIKCFNKYKCPNCGNWAKRW